MNGTVLGKYRLEAELSRGGMGAVYRARHEILDRMVAVKLLRPELTEDPELVSRFINEAKAASAIHHPGIIDVLDFGTTDDGQAYLVMELLHGESLAQRIARKKRVAPDDAIAIVRGIASALAAAHAKGIIHRDLKPDNIYLVDDPDLGERPKVLDFGIAKLADAATRTRHTQTGALMGTPLYMAPEQARSAAAIDERADLYSLGCILYELLVGEPPFKGEGAGEIIAAQMFTAPEPPSTRVEGISPGLEAVVMKLLEKEPADRYESAAQLAAALGAASSAPSTHAPRMRSPSAAPASSTRAQVAVAAPSLAPATAPRPQRRQRDLPPITIGMVVLVLIGGAAVFAVLSRGGAHRDAARAEPPPPIVRTAPIPAHVVPAPAPVPPAPVVPVTPVTQDPAPVHHEGPPRPPVRRLPVTDKGSPIEQSLD